MTYFTAAHKYMEYFTFVKYCVPLIHQQPNEKAIEQNCSDQDVSGATSNAETREQDLIMAGLHVSSMQGPASFIMVSLFVRGVTHSHVNDI